MSKRGTFAPMRRAFLAALLFVACKGEQPGEGTPYPACEGVENAAPCGKSGLCSEFPGGTVCSPKCEDDTDCPAFGGATVSCVGATFCQLDCDNAADCPDGMICEVTPGSGDPLRKGLERRAGTARAPVPHAYPRDTTSVA